jgi:ABC-type lipoprotein export system ATPase subunit
MHDAVEIKNLTKSFDDGSKHRIILNSINLKLQKGEKISIMGRSGSGKSTLINSIIGSIKIDDGSIHINNQLYGNKDNEMCRIRSENIGVVYQKDHLFTEFTAYENIILAQNIKGYENKDEADGILNELKISHVKNHFPHELSGGERQRVSIGRALVNNPVIIIADEPTGSLDEHLAEEIVEILINIDATVIMVTHDAKLAEMIGVVHILANGSLEKKL